MRNIFDVLRDVAKRPEMYVGGDPSHREEQLRNLQWFLSGYEAAVRAADPSVDAFTMGFGHYLRSRYGWGFSRGPIAAIRDAHKDIDEAWDALWDLLKRYEEHIALEAKAATE